MTHTKKILLLLAAAMLFTMACGMFNGISGLVGGQNAGTVTELWQDVPPMEGMTKANLDLPLTAKLAIQGFVKSTSKGDGSLDFISFTTQKTAQDVFDFYTVDRMTGAGWNLKDQPGCSGGQSGSAGSGGLCFFGKEQDGNTGAIISLFVSEDAKTKETTIFFIRVDVKNLPTSTP